MVKGIASRENIKTFFEAQEIILFHRVMLHSIWD
jgi:hypothetical protein